MADSDGTKLGKFNPTDVESCASEWEEYKRRFLIQLDAKGLFDAAGRRKVGQLLKHMGPEHVVTYDSFNLGIQQLQLMRITTLPRSKLKTVIIYKLYSQSSMLTLEYIDSEASRDRNS